MIRLLQLPPNHSTALACFLSLAALGALAGEKIKPGAGFKSITEKEITGHLEVVAAPGMEGRDTPSEGQSRVAAYIADHFAEWKLEFASDSKTVMREFGGQGPDHGAEDGSYYRPFLREANAPAPERCSLMLLDQKEGDVEFEFGKDYVPVHRAGGSVRGELVFGGFGISDRSHKYDDLRGLKVKDKIVLIFGEEPRHKSKFDGEEVTKGASLWSKLLLLNKEGAAGALVVRRQPTGSEDEDNRLDYRYTWASWAGGGRGSGSQRQPSKALPTLEISIECASALLDTDALALLSKMDRGARPTKVKTKGREVSFDSRTARLSIRHDNLLGILRGSDPELADEYVLLGAHYDHVGVDASGRVGCGADDNGSGVSAFLEIVEALVAAPPRRSIIICSFTGEEDGLIGAHEISRNLPVAEEKIICMINLDQIGIGDRDEVAVLGIKQNPKLQKVLDRAKRLSKTGLKSIVTGQGESLFQRSDHYKFHEIGLPTLFFFEGLPISRNKRYHTWRDTIDGVDTDKVTRTARMVYNTLWILANDDERPPAPQR